MNGRQCENSRKGSNHGWVCLVLAMSCMVGPVVNTAGNQGRLWQAEETCGICIEHQVSRASRRTWCDL